MDADTQQTLRDDMRNHLSQLSSAERRSLTEQALANFVKTSEYRRASHIGLFYPVRHELDILPLFKTCEDDGKQIYLPCLMPKPSQKMFFLPYKTGDELAPNHFGIPEPDQAAHSRIEPMQMDLVVTPLLAFGSQGERLGMGGGYYDRSFAFRLSSALRRPLLWSIALEAQRHNLVSQEWDVPIDGVSTELNNYDFS